MSNDAYTWSYLDAEGRPTTSEALPALTFPSQGEAEAWFAQEWEDVQAAGVDAVTLLMAPTLVRAVARWALRTVRRRLRRR